MARKNVFLKKLEKIDSIGATTIIASDKTGTLTKNCMTVTDIWCNNQYMSGQFCFFLQKVSGVGGGVDFSHDYTCGRLGGRRNSREWEATVARNLGKGIGRRQEEKLESRKF